MSLSRSYPLLLIALVISLTPAAWGMKVPIIIHQQGRLTDSAGNPATGTHMFTLSLYDHPTAGSKVKEVIREAGLSSDGTFDIDFGAVLELTPEDFVDPLDTGTVMHRYLEIEVDGQGPMTPRMRLVAVPYAVGAYRLAGDMFSEHNRLVMLDEVSGNPVVELEAGSTTQLAMTQTGSTGEKSRIVVHNPEWTNFNDADPGVTSENIGIAGDTTRAMLGADLLSVQNIGSSGMDGVAELGHHHLSISNIGSSGEDGIRMQHNESDLNFVMRLSDSTGTDTAAIEGKVDDKSNCWVRVSQLSSSGDQAFGQLQADTMGSELHLQKTSSGFKSEIHVKPNRIEIASAQVSPSQTKVLIAPAAMEMTDSGSAGIQTSFKVDRNGSPLGPTMTIRYPGVGGPNPEIFAGDLDGDGVPDLAVAGKVGIGTTSPSEALHVVGTACATGGHTTCSDARYKRDVREIVDPIDQVSRLRGVDFEWRRDEFPEYGFAEGRQVGFLAQEIRDVLPGVVSEGSDGYLAVDYARLTPLLVEAVKAQQKQIQELEAQLERLTRVMTQSP